MSKLDQCPSSEKEGKSPQKHEANGPSWSGKSRATGKVLWRSDEELSGSREFRDFLEREFPAFASELLDGSRRHFLKIMGASIALAGASTLPGCRRPDHKILAYNQDPEHIVPGKPLFYATALALPGGGCEGLLAETHEGRPTKLEGNPLHPTNRGRSSVRSQAAVLSLYDPDRDPRAIAEMAGDSTGITPWDMFSAFASSHFPAYDATGGRGLVFLVEKVSSPSRDELRAKILKRWPRAKWYVYEPVDNENVIEGTRLAFGEPHIELLNLAKANVVVSLDRDFLGAEGTLADQRGWSAGRYRRGQGAGHAAGASSMSRLYSVESMMTLTGGQADHRLRVKPTDVRSVAFALAHAVLRQLPRDVREASGLESALAGVSGQESEHAKWIDAVAKDLIGFRPQDGHIDGSNLGRTAVLAGANQPPEVHAVVAALNSALGNVGISVSYRMIEGDVAELSSRNIVDLASDIDSGAVETLVVLGSNPVYDAPADVDFSTRYAKVANRIHFGSWNETAAASTIHVERAHFLEAWSDATSIEGTYSVAQPMIAPLFAGRGELEFLAVVAGESSTDPFEIVKSTVSSHAGAGAAEKTWRRTLHDGVMSTELEPGASPQVRWNEIATAVSRSSALKSEGLDVLFVPCPKVHDGRYANNGWLQELPHTITKISWDNPALISRKTAETLGITLDRHPKTPQYNHAQVVDVSLNGQTVRMPVWVQPGLADDTIVLTLGYGRTHCGQIGTGTGFDVYPLRHSSGMRIASGAKVAKASGEKPYLLANTQDHWAMEGRDPIREVDLAAWQKHGDEDIADDPSIQIDQYGRDRGINFAERLGIESHTPAGRTMYLDRQQHSYVERGEDGQPLRDANGNLIAKKNKYGKRIQQWGMSIDLTKCTGCGACTIACQAENNIPIVGKMEVAKGREMHWIRVDRYYASTEVEDAWGVNPAEDPSPEMLVQPIPCQQCENAPCEVVCPVNATTHSHEGLNDMAYNRCIGTRYCSNNCPYKVRRFNYFDYGTKQPTSGFGQLGEGIPDSWMPSNRAFIPPRLREPKPEVLQMQSNPHVTVRSRGVMEKCTYCVQRINSARVETKLEDLDHVPDGFVQTACQQACPTDAIVFGDIYDHEANSGRGSLVKQHRESARTYGLLGYLLTKPRTTYMVRLRNPNPLIRKPNDDPFHHGHGSDSHDEGAGHDDHHARGSLLSLPILQQAGVLA